MNHDMTKFFSITLFLWIAFPLCAMAAEAAGGESTPAASGTEVNAPATTGTGGNPPAAASAGESTQVAANGGKPAKVKVGDRTSQWLDSQREGRNPGNLLPIPGAEAGLSYRRYIDSFGKPIPDQLGYTASSATTSSTAGTSR